jgi:hypothetical protein
MDGWDARPIAENEPGRAPFWFTRSPEKLTAFVNDAIVWAESNPQIRPEASPTPPLVLLEAWNEFSKRATCSRQWETGPDTEIHLLRHRPALRPRRAVRSRSLTQGLPVRVASPAEGLTSADGGAIAGATITLTAMPVSGICFAGVTTCPAYRVPAPPKR